MTQETMNDKWCTMFGVTHFFLGKVRGIARKKTVTQRLSLTRARSVVVGLDWVSDERERKREWERGK